MRARYSLTFTGQCPVNGDSDVYDLEVVSSTPIMVEDIIGAVSEATKESRTQEQITKIIRSKIPARITTIGFHSGVRAEVTEE